jgi:heat shock protein HslJ
MKSSLTAATVIGFALVLASCGDNSGGAGDSATIDVDGRTFVGQSVTIDDAAHDLVPGSTLRLSFDDGTIGASAGCNSMGGSATWRDATLRIDGATLAATEMACDPALMKQETWYARLLTGSPTLLLDGASLTLTHGATVVTLTDEDVAVPDVSLTDTRWALDAIVNGDAVSSVPRGAPADVTFSTDGSFTSHLGCNRGSGTYTVTGQRLEIGSMATTKMACEAPASEVESAMISVLQGRLGVSIDGEVLTLTPDGLTGDGPTSLSFRAA